ncbi:DNA mismatch repair protein MutL [Labilithrix luteola]|uniref:DNA mismatch repair protein MutL n=1 Tax=Labilithrix luteola TaxID=1391654 RepID=A0A0K1PM66_9BACT|nr:DNA mismatch repair endonuclease MutL [Labilithrix luteola]AKU94491.1 DNA mismatch repair protein MutL [Labilithrix luteola]
MGRIRKLSDELANQIAAGEVVERPSSIVKELVENSLDAGATRIVVDIEQGGRTLIRVTDDGEGMTADDAVACFDRHATSKIAKIADLAALGTFGFRGEAIPSIASVSRLLLRTRPRGGNEGVEVYAEGTGPGPAQPAGGAVGTTIEVRDLFFNVPARRKFLKATATESAHVGDVILGAALARPDVTFVLSRDGRVVREYLRAATRADRVRTALTGEKLAECLVERGPIRVEALLAPPERARAGTTGLSLLVNGRHVRDRLFARAVAQSYGSVLESGRYPVGVVWLDVPPDVVDVNVHPQKAEVRFADARGIFDAITRELGAALSKAFGLPTLGGTPGAPWARPPGWSAGPRSGPPAWVTASRTKESDASAEVEVYEPPPMPLFDVREPMATSASTSRGELPPPLPLPTTNLFAERSEPAAPATDLFGGESLYASLRFVGQVKATFLVCEGNDGLYVLDQHAAAERVTFDRLRRAYASRGLGIQKLLLPEVVELTPSEVALLEDQADEIASLGVEVRAVGESAVAVHGVPDLLARAQPARIVRDLAAELSRAAGRPFRGAIDLVLATMACHGSIRAGDAISREEAEALLRALDQVDFAGHCPHGRPVIMRLSFGELERRVGR